ncbi:MAG: protein-L-isoaspartate(D-aspartate) O-methyltransferase [Candidatus Aminicenantes bacterium]|nr:protein-L-isoaspartate(D-aspartate) O-methyltransferase [Candidatus Aminicenantes bacterium]
MGQGLAAGFVALAIAGLFFCSGRPDRRPAEVQTEEDAFARRRRAMISDQLASRDIKDKKVLEVMGTVPRHLFVDPGSRNLAYEDYPLPIAEGQTISQPYIVALMTQCLELRGKEKVLEIGTGSGYQAAVLSSLVSSVFSVEYHPALAAASAALLKKLGYVNVQVRAGDGFFGWPEEAPFDGIIVTCAARRVPESLLAQLAEGGRLVIPVGETDDVQRLVRVRKVEGKPVEEEITLVRFVPMLGADRKK